MHIHWFPGHMAKAYKMIREHLKLVDVVIELLDARIPLSSANPVIHELVGNKPRVIALNKADLAEPQWTERWIAEYRRQGLAAVPLEAVSGKGVKTLIVQVETAVRPKLKALEAKGIQGRTVRAIILGIPNVGKSSLINRLLGAAVVRTGDRPGVTRGQQWIKIGKNLELLDTPGVLWPKFDDQEVAFKLAITGAIHEDVYDVEAVATKLLHMLRSCYTERLVERFKLSPPLPEDAAALLDLIGSKRGCLRAGGIVDHEKVRRIILTEFRTGKLGPFTLDYPPAAKNM
ncbi:GTP-binding protein, HSR1-related [Thermosinus carboxydivorans Nor1]|uniref:Ribosome biogenesis GTPase A n=1 Tax=Thermosinus carboxydivorans Nor1 TaxID=401526 RepID=A1HN68_9FIRM|nr:ribosome biogenesis GTPase YlqF [Thermosinus carboxydivorans]EAX48694.1 GTP-binding protein, HSR1-related [Thermosinus carboxydivorans Nor1]